MMQFHSKFSFLLLLCLMHICIEAKGTEHDEPLVTLDMKQTPIRKVLAEITRQTGVTFSYESSLTKHLLPIDITITAQPLSHCLRHSVSKTARRIYTIRQIHHPQEKTEKHCNQRLHTRQILLRVPYRRLHL